MYFANAQPLHVRFQHAAPAHAAEYERAFGVAVEFDQPCSEIELAAEVLDITSPHADLDMYGAQRVIAERRLLRVSQDAPYGVRVRELLLERFPARINMASVAQALGLSERSLRTQLGGEGTTFREIEHAALGACARKLLQDERRTIQESAHQMGFSDATTFHRAVKRWTGKTPSALRERGKCTATASDQSSAFTSEVCERSLAPAPASGGSHRSTSVLQPSRRCPRA